MLELTAVEAGYRDVTVLHGIDLEVRAGEIVALIGPNGAGKTTLARTIAGLLPLRRGQIRFSGAPIERLPPWTRIRLGMAHAPEGRQVVGGLTAPHDVEQPDDNSGRLFVVEQGGTILQWAADVASAQALRSFMLGAGGRALLKQYGFFLPGE